MSSALFSQLEPLCARAEAGTIVAVCESAELELAHELLSSQDSATLYKLQMLGYLLDGQMEAARFLWKRLPPSLREEPELAALWGGVGKASWARNTPAALKALAARAWAPPLLPELVEALKHRLREEEWNTVGNAFSVIRPETLAGRLGMTLADAKAAAAARGWQLGDDGCIHPKKPAPSPGPMPGADTLRQLTQYVAHLTADAGV